MFTGTDARGRPTQLSQDGPRRQARRAARRRRARGRARARCARRSQRQRRARRMGRPEPRHVGAVVGARPAEPGAHASRRIRSLECRWPGSSVGDVERWHTRLRRAGMGDAGIKNLHGVLRAALSQAVRWGWASTNVASMARLRSTKTQRRTVMTLDEVRAVMAAARVDRPGGRVDAARRRGDRRSPRRARCAAVDRPRRRRCSTIDSAIEIVDSPATAHREFTRRGDQDRQHVAPSRSTPTPSPPSRRCAPSASRTGRGCSASAPSSSAPIGSAGGGSEPASSPASTSGGGSTTCATGRPPWPSARATTCAPSPAASDTPTRR